MEDSPWINGCLDHTIEALLFLSKNERPKGGNEKFNAEHLHQLARELIISEAKRIGNDVTGADE